MVARHQTQDTRKKQDKVFFITGTDTGVGKTVATFVLGTLLQRRGKKVGVMKPVQCGGQDARFLKRALELDDELVEINPCFAPEPLSPHLAFRRKKLRVNLAQILHNAERLKQRHDILLVEGAGGLLVPLAENYFVADLVRDLGAELIIVARPGLGTINHTLLTVNQARQAGIGIQGIVFSAASGGKSGLPEKTNPQIIGRLTGVPVLGVIPHLKRLDQKEILRRCSSLKIALLLSQEKNRHARRLAKWDQEYVWHPFTQMQDWRREEPLVVEEAKGCYLKDTQGNWYLDGVSSLWVNVHGHRKKEIDAALKKQIDRLSHSTLLGLSNTPAVELAKRLVEIAPKGLTKVFYSDNGSTAVEVAIKMAYQYWQNIGRKKKRLIVHLADSYHGDTLGSVSIGGIDLFHKVYRGLRFKTIQVVLSNGDLRPLEKLFSQKHDRIAAFVVEPLVQGAAGMIVWPKGTLKKMEGLCRKYEVLLIADEVATGFGRTGKMFACEHENVRPDLLCLAKGLTGGYLPLAATLTTQRVYDGFLRDYKDQKTFFHGHTYTGNPLGCAAALANLEIFRKERTLVKLAPKIKYLSKRLAVFYNLPAVGDVRQQGFMVGIELFKDRLTKKPYPWQDRIGVNVCREARRHGVILRPLGNVIVLMPPLAITIDELSRLLDVTYRAIEKATGKDTRHNDTRHRKIDGKN